MIGSTTRARIVAGDRHPHDSCLPPSRPPRGACSINRPPGPPLLTPRGRPDSHGSGLHRGNRRSRSPDLRSLLAGGDGMGRDDKRKDQPEPPPRREIHRDTPQRPPAPAPKPAGHQPPPPPSAAGDRSKNSDFDRRLERKSGPSDPEPSARGRGGDGGRQPADKYPAAKNVSPPSVEGDRTNAADVRRRLGGRGPGDPAAGEAKSHVAQPPSAVQSRPGQPGRPSHKQVLGWASRTARFPEQLKSGELDRLTRGETAKRVQLADQYRLSQQGDVARRLDLQKTRAGHRPT